MKINHERKLIEGFKNEKLISLSDNKIKPIKDNVYFTDICYFPQALYHYIERSSGATEHILCFCSSGQGYVQTNEHSFQHIHENMYFFIRKNTPHKYFSSMDKPWSVYFLHFLCDDIAECLPNKLNCELYYSSLNNPVVQNLIYSSLTHAITLLTQEISLENIKYTNDISALILKTLDNTSTTNTEYNPKSMLVSKLNVYIQKNLDRNITLKDVCRALSTSASTLNNAINEEKSMSPMSYITLQKILYSANLLITTDLKIKLIAIQVGYENQYHYSRVFKKYMDVSPNTYRINKSLQKRK